MNARTTSLWLFRTAQCAPSGHAKPPTNEIGEGCVWESCFVPLDALILGTLDGEVVLKGVNGCLSLLGELVVSRCDGEWKNGRGGEKEKRRERERERERKGREKRKVRLVC